MSLQRPRDDLRGEAIDSGHHIAEERPQLLASLIESFLNS
jgi:hypothetical protein